jgi:hypothetical protein
MRAPLKFAAFPNAYIMIRLRPRADSHEPRKPSAQTLVKSPHTHTKDIQPNRLYMQHAVVAFWCGGVMFILHAGVMSRPRPIAHYINSFYVSQVSSNESDVFNNACGLLCHSFIFNLCVLAVSARRAIIRFAPHINRGAFV